MDEKQLKELSRMLREKRKRKFEEAKRRRKLETPSSPMAEAADLKSAQCQFESDLGDDEIRNSNTLEGTA